MKAVLGLAVLLLASIEIQADGPAEIPATVRSAEHFYGAVGSGVGVTLTVNPATVAIGEAATLTVTVSNVTNPAGVTRPPLDSMPAWVSTVQIENGPTRTGENKVTFQYVLRPRGAGTITLPRLRFAYFNPSAAPGRQLQTTYADSVTLTVTPRRAEPIVLPERFGKPVTRPALSLPSPFAVWLACIVVASVCTPVAWRLARRHAADDRTLARRTALATATARLRAARSSPDPAAVVGEVVRTHATTFDLPADAVADLTAACDAARFGPGGVNAVSLVERAERLIGGTP